MPNRELMLKVKSYLCQYLYHRELLLKVQDQNGYYIFLRFWYIPKLCFIMHSLLFSLICMQLHSFRQYSDENSAFPV